MCGFGHQVGHHYSATVREEVIPIQKLQFSASHLPVIGGVMPIAFLGAFGPRLARGQTFLEWASRHSQL